MSSLIFSTHRNSLSSTQTGLKRSVLSGLQSVELTGYKVSYITAPLDNATNTDTIVKKYSFLLDLQSQLPWPQHRKQSALELPLLREAVLNLDVVNHVQSGLSHPTVATS